MSLWTSYSQSRSCSAPAPPGGVFLAFVTPVVTRLLLYLWNILNNIDLFLGNANCPSAARLLGLRHPRRDTLIDVHELCGRHLEHRQHVNRWVRTVSQKKLTAVLDSSVVLRELTNGHRVECAPRGHNRYGRTVAVCRTESGELNATMVQRGWAVDYTRYSGGRYHSEEQNAPRSAGHLDRAL
jgi:Staphylococcal nuclease homologue